MNNVDNGLPLQHKTATGLVSVALLTLILALGASHARAQEPAPSVSSSPTPTEAAISSVEAAKGAAEGTTVDPVMMDTPVEAADEEKADTDAMANLSTDEVLNMLRAGNSGEPLNVRQLAAINNLIKRMEYISAIEKKMGEMSLGGGVSAPQAAAVSAAPSMGGAAAMSGMGGGSSSANGYSVLRVSGAAGSYAAVISNGSTQLQVKPGDVTPIGRIASVSMSGVTVVTEEGAVPLSFAAPGVMSGVTATISGR